jgi:hypothetical protein
LVAHGVFVSIKVKNRARHQKEAEASDINNNILASGKKTEQP